MVVGAHEVVGGGLRGGVGAVRGVRRALAEGRVVGAEGAEDLVGRDVEEPEGVALRLREPLQVAVRRLEQRVRAEDVGAQERRRVVDGAVDVALRREVDDRRGAVLGEEPRDEVAVADVAADEEVVGVVLEVGQVVEVARVREQVEVHDARQVALARQAHEVGADEPGAAGDQPGLLHDPRASPLRYACPHEGGL